MKIFRDDILKALNGEKIEGLVIGTFQGMGLKDKQNALNSIQGEVLDGEKLSFLHYRYEKPEDCHAFYLWTPTRVVFNSTEGIKAKNRDEPGSLPRNPRKCRPRLIEWLEV